MWPLLIGAALGGAKAYSNKLGHDRDKKVRAAEQQFSPWSKLGVSTDVRNTNPIGDIAGGALSGYSMKQNMDRTDLVNELLKEKIAKQKLDISAFKPEPFKYTSNTWGELGG